MSNSKAPTLPPRPAKKAPINPAISDSKDSVSTVSSHPIEDVDSPSYLPTPTAGASAAESPFKPAPSNLSKTTSTRIEPPVEPQPSKPAASKLPSLPARPAAKKPQQLPVSTIASSSKPMMVLEQPSTTTTRTQQQQQPYPSESTTSTNITPAQQQLVQQQAQQWAAALTAASGAVGSSIMPAGFPALGFAGKDPSEIAASIERAVLTKMSTGQQPPSMNQNPMMIPSALGNGPDLNSIFRMDEEENQSCMDLYRGAYFDRVDMFLGPVIVCLVALLFWAEILSFWAAFIVVPIIIVSGLHFVLVKAARMQPHSIPFSRFPCGLIVSLEAAAVVTFIYSMAPLLPDQVPLIGLMLGLSAVAYYIHYKCIKSEPGALPTPSAPVELPEDQRMLLNNTVSAAHCWSCNIYKPIRSKHCSVCNRCFEEFDHHCPVISNCVAKNNKRMFFTYLTTLFAAEIFWMKLAITFHKRVLMSYLHLDYWPSIWSLIWNVFTLGRINPGATYMTFLVCFIISGTGFLFARQAFLTAGNITTNELLTRKRRYDYLFAEDGTFYNPFDMGPSTNCLQFWQENNVDWYKMYSERQGLNPEYATPHWSVSTLLRAKDRAVIALEKGRELRKKKREEWLLEHYGRGGGAGNGCASGCPPGAHSHPHNGDAEGSSSAADKAV